MTAKFSVYIEESILHRLTEKDVSTLSQSWKIAKTLASADVAILSEDFILSIDLYNEFFVSPVIIYKPSLSVPEYTLEHLHLSHILEVLDTTKEIAEKVGKIKKDSKRKIFELFYGGLVYLWSRNKKIEPVITSDVEKGYGYLFFDTVLGALNRGKNLSGKDIFNYLAEANLVITEEAEVAHTCPKCESILLLFRDTCINCQSPHVEENTIIHHFSCGYQAAERQFITKNEALLNEHVCPKCQKPLRHFGLDYDKPGSIYFCKNCNESNSETEVALKCITCGFKGKTENSSRLTLLSYEINTAGKLAILNPEANILNVEHFLSEHVQIIPFNMFALIAKKIAAFRGGVQATVVTFSLKNDDTSDIMTNSKTLYEIGKTLAHATRKSDCVSYYSGVVFVLFAEASTTSTEAFIQGKKEFLKKTFSDNVFQKIAINIYDNKEFIGQYENS